MTAVDLVSVTPAVHVNHLKACGFKSDGGRQTKYTVTLYRRYSDAALAADDGQRLPKKCVWSIEEVRN